MADFKKIYKPIAAEMLLVEKKIRKVLQVEDKVLKSIINCALSTPGKRLRPALVIFSAQLGKRSLKKAVDLAVVFELIHTATLIQDDVVDNANKRRGKKTLRKVFGSNISILFGDYLFSKASSLLLRIKNPEIFLEILKVTNAMAAGEIEHLYLAGRNISRGKYLDIIKKKTANFFSVCCQAGGQLGGAGQAECRALAAFGLYFGMAFQIADDCKDTHLDSRLGRITLPSIYIRQKANKPEAVNLSMLLAEAYCKKAVKAIDGLKNNKVKDSLTALVEHVKKGD